MIIPRENGLVRLYISLGDLPPGQRLDRTKLTAESILDSARKILHPYHLEATHIDWCSSFRAISLTAQGHATRSASASARCDAGRRTELTAQTFSAHERVFIAGDACHTHSPKAGQGVRLHRCGAADMRR